MTDPCIKDQCTGCLWTPYHSCVDAMGQQQCESSMDHIWCGNNNNNNNNNTASLLTTTTTHKSSTQRYEKHPKHRSVKYVRAAYGTTGCGACTGCWETSTDPAIGCYSWTEATCNNQGSGYQWCGSSTGGGGGGGSSLNCCNSSTGTCQTVTSATSCPAGSTSVSSCSTCTAAVPCANPYYGLDSNNSSSTSCGLSTLLPNNAVGLKRWLTLFPVLDPKGQLYALNGCEAANSTRPTWGAGCTMFGQGENNGLAAFLTAAAQFPAFANGPDSKRNLVELAAFFGNVMQETSSLLYSAELNSCPSSLFGKGVLQLTGAFNYVFATQGLAKPSDYNQNITMQQGTLTGACAGQDLVMNSLEDCWATCAAATPVPPPHGSGYNVCAKPWLASGYNDTTSPPKYDPVPAWTTALWYWMNRPIEASKANGFYGIQGDVSCATAHNLIQDPQYNCGEWCGVTAIAQIGCGQCCTGPMTVPGAETVSRVGNFVKAAAILGLPEAQGSNVNSFYCMLINTCTTGSKGVSNTTCPQGLSYDCYLNGTCDGGGGGGGGGNTSAICGNVTHASPFPVCAAVPNNPQNVKNSDCAPCATGITFWPCNKPGLCQWASN